MVPNNLWTIRIETSNRKPWINRIICRIIIHKILILIIYWTCESSIAINALIICYSHSYLNKINGLITVLAYIYIFISHSKWTHPWPVQCQRPEARLSSIGHNDCLKDFSRCIGRWRVFGLHCREGVTGEERREEGGEGKRGREERREEGGETWGRGTWGRGSWERRGREVRKKRKERKGKKRKRSKERMKNVSFL